MAINERMNDMNDKLSRRNFMAGSASTALAMSMATPGTSRTAETNSKIRVGIIGCGGRGKLIAGLMAEHGGYEIAAVADYFDDKVQPFGEEFNVPANRRFTGLSGYRKLLDQKLDAVAVMSPPYFHPEHAAAAVDAGRHVYIAKPVALDVPGCSSISDTGKKATDKGLCFLVDFQTRSTEFYVEAVKRVHDGAIGEIAFGEAAYHANRLKSKTDERSPEARLRNWVFDKALSGDIITEQNIHALDVMSWIMNEPPIYAIGTGGRKVRTDVGDCWDHFAVLFQYPNDVGITFSSRQFNGHGTPVSGITNRMFGSEGVLETKYGGDVLIRGTNFYRGGKTSTIYKDGAKANVATFHENIITGKFDNPTVEPSVTSNLVTILGRTAAYEKRLVKWNEITKSKVELDGQLDRLKT
jgi:myo-inositol 2-dehydrogenase/D-chiro-inositol 1-dehydrogenase